MSVTTLLNASTAWREHDESSSLWIVLEHPAVVAFLVFGREDDQQTEGAVCRCRSWRFSVACHGEAGTVQQITQASISKSRGGQTLPLVHLGRIGVPCTAVVLSPVQPQPTCSCGLKSIRLAGFDDTAAYRSRMDEILSYNRVHEGRSALQYLRTHGFKVAADALLQEWDQRHREEGSPGCDSLESTWWSAIDRALLDEDLGAVEDIVTRWAATRQPAASQACWEWTEIASPPQRIDSSDDDGSQSDPDTMPELVSPVPSPRTGSLNPLALPFVPGSTASAER